MFYDCRSLECRVLVTVVRNQQEAHQVHYFILAISASSVAIISYLAVADSNSTAEAYSMSTRNKDASLQSTI